MSCVTRRKEGKTGLILSAVRSPLLWCQAASLTSGSLSTNQFFSVNKRVNGSGMQTRRDVVVVETFHKAKPVLFA